jgi:hypothetical protein
MRLSWSLLMNLHKSAKQLIEIINDLNNYLLYVPEVYLDQDGIIEISNQAKAWDPEWHEAMVNIKFDIFEISYEESVSYFESL